MSVLTLQQGKGNKVHLLIDGAYRMTADSDFVALAGLYDNMELDGEALADLTREVNARRAFQKASDLLSRRDHSAFELRQKLRQKGYGDGAEAAIEKLQDYGYVDDRRFAQSYAQELYTQKKFGKRRIEQELLRKGIDRDIIRDVTETLEEDPEALCALIERKYARDLTTEKGVQKTINALVRLGHSYGEIRAALRLLQEKEEEET